MKNEETKELSPNKGMNTQTKALLIGSVAGGILGAVTGILLSKRIEESEGKFQFTTNEGMRLGMLIFSFLKDISRFG